MGSLYHDLISNGYMLSHLEMFEVSRSKSSLAAIISASEYPVHPASELADLRMISAIFLVDNSFRLWIVFIGGI